MGLKLGTLISLPASSAPFRTQVAQHFIGDAVGNFRPNVNDFVISLTVRNQAVFILLLNFTDIVVGFKKLSLLGGITCP
jgi:hypothetical protein